jgi:hypothetical protein
MCCTSNSRRFLGVPVDSSTVSGAFVSGSSSRFSERLLLHGANQRIVHAPIDLDATDSWRNDQPDISFDRARRLTIACF